MDSTVLSSSSSNPTTLGGQVCFRSVNFLPHLPALLPAFGNFGRGLDLAIGSFYFRVGTNDTFRLSGPIYSGSSADGSASATATWTSAAGSMSEANSTPMARSNVFSAASLGDLTDLLDDVSFGSNSDTLSDRVLQIMDPENIINNKHDDDSA
jgi:hypothetical protein